MPIKNLALAVSFLLVVYLASLAAAETGERPIDSTPVFRVSVPVDSPAQQVREIRALGIYVDAYYDKTRTVSAIVTEPELATLRAMGYEPTIQRAVLQVGAVNYSMLLERSLDWPTYRTIMIGAYPDPLDVTRTAA